MNEYQVSEYAVDLVFEALTSPRVFQFHTKKDRYPHSVVVKMKGGWEFPLAKNTIKSIFLLRTHQWAIWLEKRLETA